ncbi:MAG: class I SAM-dependent methyltransferase [Armatimonadota bacterium]
MFNMQQDEINGSNGIDRQFNDIAFLYDDLMSAVPYSGWINYVEELLREHKYRPVTVLDLCCGTGSASLLLARKGYKVTGVDISPRMIEIAKERSAQAGGDVEFYVQDATRFNLGRCFNLVISLFDSLNYILKPDHLLEAFRRAAAHMDEGGLFIFDMNTEYALAAGLFNQRNLDKDDLVQYNWCSTYNPATRICTIKMSFLHKETQKRVETVHYQHAYQVDEIIDMLGRAGLNVLAAYCAYTFRKASDRCDRVFFVAQK